MAQQPARRKMQAPTSAVSIPDKLYFRIGDVSSLCDLPAYVLRFWETEFPQLKPNKGGTGQRLYRKRDVERVLEIKRLLYEEGFTIAGARRSLAEKGRSAPIAHNRRADDHPAEDAEAAAMETEARPVAAPRILEKRKKTLPQQDSAVGENEKKNQSGKDGRKEDGRKISDLRKEMREILSLLKSEPEKRPALQPARRGGKKNPSEDEPTLF